ncbi:uncharacterized protein LOC62_03G004628 [Vanrija pseudolonga]|uniref:Uncharacterized protein n=1 Tax=Vanrija pseudolonga TaxID=143232 RepID=A0AAF0YCM0_9TREE|nr:hypothetical protein LOC62_03G004628 [Vanrija pseudolonga]
MTPTTTTTTSQPIPQANAVASTSAASTPSASPQQATSMPGAATTPGQLEGRLNALLSSFDIGTHGLCREERRTGEFAKPHPQTKPAAPRDPSPSRSPLLSLLSLTRPRMSVSGASTSAPTTPRGSIALPSPGLDALSTANPFNNAVAAPRGRPTMETQRRHSHFDPGREPKLHGLF